MRKSASLLIAFALVASTVAIAGTSVGRAAAATTAPSAPYRFRVKSTCEGALLTWSAPKTGNPVTSYDVYRSSDRVSFALLDSTSNTSYTDTTGGTNVRNYYRVTAVNTVGEGTPTRAPAAAMTCDPVDTSLTKPSTTTTTAPSTTTTTVPQTTTTTTVPNTARFSTLPPGSALPSDATCASEIHAVATATAEPRPANTNANHTVPPPGSFTLRALNSYYGYDNRAQTLEGRVTGNFTGTTDQIIQWAACKWGWDEDVVRAIAVNETNWDQAYLGDYKTTSNCPAGYSSPCPYSFGIHQVTWSSDPVGSFPWSRDATAFNLDVSMMIHRVCYEGYTQWLKSSAPNYAAGDMWGCVGQWYSGYWHDSGAETYISHVQQKLSAHAWTAQGF